MTFTTVLSVLGILATVLFGAWGVYVVIRRRYPGEITLVIDDCIGLFDTIVKNFPDLAVLYKQQPVSHGLVLMKAAFLNSGGRDISPEMVEKEISLRLPDGFKWLAAKTVRSSPDVTSSVVTEPDSLKFTTGLFRCHEYFKFEALAEVPIPQHDGSIEKHLLTNVRTDHRIADTGNIREVLLPPQVYISRNFKSRITFHGALILIGIVALSVFLLPSFRGKPVLRFNIPQQDGSVAHLSATPRLDGTIHIEDKTHDIDEIVDAKLFLSRPDIQPTVVANPKTRYADAFALLLLCFVVVQAALFCFDIRGKRKWSRLREQLGIQ